MNRFDQALDTLRKLAKDRTTANQTIRRGYIGLAARLASRLFKGCRLFFATLQNSHRSIPTFQAILSPPFGQHVDRRKASHGEISVAVSLRRLEHRPGLVGIGNNRWRLSRRPDHQDLAYVHDRTCAFTVAEARRTSKLAGYSLVGSYAIDLRLSTKPDADGVVREVWSNHVLPWHTYGRHYPFRTLLYRLT